MTEDKDRRARWRDSINSRPGTKSAVPLSLHGQATEILVNIRLLPIMKILNSTSDKDILFQALRRALAVLDFAVAQDASSAIQGKCCYYVGVAKHMLEDNDAITFFHSALETGGVFEEKNGLRNGRVTMTVRLT